MEDNKPSLKCPNCGEEENLHINYDYSLKDMPIEGFVCNECKTYTDIEDIIS